ncbi:uncharacterized protein Dana_GF21924 [Drosophila ananassae]|uniref:Uncharacterized protein n=1 Tax=Drosophila ananassae TaxID=7217 RepID=B3MZ07_DROAN|nr:uncharacterized protein LOC6504594 [Drosophila ananassae]EDV32851.1 uncharacterized protein Dana_GF21924 [Drosophila ananassae]
MDLFIRKELTLNSSTDLEDVAPNCLKLLVWLRSCQEEMRSQNRRLRLTQSLIETMLKALVYLFECYARFGVPLADRVDSHLFFEQCSTSDGRRQYIRDLCKGIVNTRKGELLAPLLHFIQKPLSEVQPDWGVIRELDWSEIRQTEPVSLADIVHPDLQQMRCLVKRICRLPSLESIQTALHRSMELIGFPVWLHLYQEPRENSLHSDCLLLSHMISDILVEGKSPVCSSFLHHIFDFVAKPANEIRFFACLDHVRLAGCLITFLTSYWKLYLPHLDLEEMEMAPNGPAIDTKFPIDDATFVTHLMLGNRSPCRYKFHQQLVTTLPPATTRQMKQLLSKAAFVYS